MQRGGSSDDDLNASLNCYPNFSLRTDIVSIFTFDFEGVNANANYVIIIFIPGSMITCVIY
jgi:hypothetical protein